MSKLRILSPGNGDKVSPLCPVNGDCDLAEGTQVTCTISKGTFRQSETATVDASGRWAAKLGARTPIPVGTDYKIEANATVGTAVDRITVALNPQEQQD